MTITPTVRIGSASASAFGTGPYTTASFTPSNNSLLIVCIGGGFSATSTFAPTISDSVGLTWTQHLTVSQNAASWTDGFTMWTAPVVTGVSMTVTADHGADSIFYYGVSVIDVTGMSATFPVGNLALNGALTVNGAQSITLSGVPRADSLVIGALFRDMSSATVTSTEGSGWTEIQDFCGTATCGFEIEHKSGLTSTAVDWVDADTAGSGANTFRVMGGAIEIRDAAAPDPPVIVTAGGTLNSAASTTTLAGDVGVAFAVGDVIVVAIAADNNGTAGVTSLSSVSDVGSNTYELLQATFDPGAAAAGQTVGLAWARITTALISTDDVTITFSPATTAKAAAVFKLHPDSGTVIQKVTSAFTAGSTTGTPTVTTGTINSGDVVVAALAAESNAAVTADTDLTKGVWSAQQTATGNSGTAATSARVAAQAKVVTATATQSYDPVIASCDNILGWITFTPAFIRPKLLVRPAVPAHDSYNW